MVTEIGVFSLKGKTALITGATGHLGRSMAFAFARAGAQVLVNSRDPESNKELVAQLTIEGLCAESAIFDVASNEAVRDFSDSLNGRPINVLVNNAYVGGAGTVESSSGNSYMASYGVTVVAAHNLLTTLLPNIRKAVHACGDASVINVASMYALVSPDQDLYDSPESTNPPFYGAAKAALLQWTRYAACEFGREGIRVNSVSPGPFPSPFVQANNPEFIKKLQRKVPLGRIGAPEEIKGPMLFLASSAASFVNGSNIVVDGGWTCW